MTKGNMRPLVNTLDKRMCAAVLCANEDKDAIIYNLMHDNDFLHTRLSRAYSRLGTEDWWNIAQSADFNIRDLINNLDIALCRTELVALHIQDISQRYEHIMEFFAYFNKAVSRTYDKNIGN